MQQLNFLTTDEFLERKTQRQLLEERLKRIWMSYTDMIVYLNAGCADRRCREIRENPPKDFKLIQRTVKRDKKSPCLEFKLVRAN